MDFRINKFPKVRVLLRRGSAPALHLPRLIESLRSPALWIYGVRRRLATVLVGLVTVWLFAHVTFGANGMIIYRSKRTEIQSLKKEIEALQTENDRYSNQIESLKTDPKTIEKEAREQLHYARPGEMVYLTPDPQNPEVPRTDSAHK